ncbi:hypothetical protein BH10BAC4_BH10BAC4_18610 [soil metagenome]
MTTQPYKPTYDTEGKPARENNHDILVFKTNILTHGDVEKIAPILSDQFRILKWTVDLNDIDKVLRIESQLLGPREIIEMILQAGYQCEELPD